MSDIKNTYIKVNISKATCRRCGKSVEWTDTTLLYIPPCSYALCSDCKTAVLDFIKGEER